LSKAFVMIIVGALALAQVFPSCGGEERTVVGWIERKFPYPVRNAYIIVINDVEYDVPPEFYEEVRIGDLVKFEHGLWTIVRRAQGR